MSFESRTHQTTGSMTAKRPLILVHYMPWYESKTVSGHWGWHWTMNHFNPDRPDSSGRQPLASQFRPLIGAYDSSDPDVLECQTLQMKLAGIDGVLIDWYGTKNLNDYALLNRNTDRMIEACAKVGLKFGIVMEDQVVPQLVKAKKATPGEYATSAMEHMKSRWFKLPGYLNWKGKPLLLIFGPQYYKDADLEFLFGKSAALFTLLNRRGGVVGGFGWPEPQVGDEKSWVQLRAFYDRAKTWPSSVAVAYPRFEDIYKAAGIGPGYGEIRDQSGATFKNSLTLAWASHAPWIQIATWNDWGEGTQVEPSVEFGYRDLAVLQRLRRSADPSFSYVSADMSLPTEIYGLRKNRASPKKLDRAVQEILARKPSRARELLRAIPAHP